MDKNFPSPHKYVALFSLSLCAWKPLLRALLCGANNIEGKKLSIFFSLKNWFCVIYNHNLRSNVPLQKKFTIG